MKRSTQAHVKRAESRAKTLGYNPGEAETEADAYLLEKQAQADFEAKNRNNRNQYPPESDGDVPPLDPPSNNGSGGAFENDPAREWAENGRFTSIENSSNVFAAAYDKRTEELYVQFKDWEPGTSSKYKLRDGPGPIYKYLGVSMETAISLYKAASAGEWVWDELRIRGTWAGHKYPYVLTSISGDYLPRMSVVMRNDEWWVQRKLRDDQGNVTVSSLPKRKAPPVYNYSERERRNDRNLASPQRGANVNRGRANNNRPRRPNDGRPR